MDDGVERLNGVLDDLAAERDPRERASLSPEDAELARAAAFLKATDPQRAVPRAEFVDRLGEALAAADAPDEQSDPTPHRARDGLSRRGLLGRLVVGAAGLVVGAGAGAAAASNGAGAAYEQGKRDGYRAEASERFAAPLVPQDRGAWLDTGHTVGSIAPGRAERFRAGAVEGFLVNPGASGAMYALSAACTHMGCLISWIDSAQSFLCPCHGAQYSAGGAVLSGVARHPLPRLRVRTTADGRLQVWSVGEHPAITSVAPYGQP